VEYVSRDLPEILNVTIFNVNKTIEFKAKYIALELQNPRYFPQPNTGTCVSYSVILLTPFDSNAVDAYRLFVARMR